MIVLLVLRFDFVGLLWWFVVLCWCVVVVVFGFWFKCFVCVLDFVLLWLFVCCVFGWVVFGFGLNGLSVDWSLIVVVRGWCGFVCGLLLVDWVGFGCCFVCLFWVFV